MVPHRVPNAPQTCPPYRRDYRATFGEPDYLRTWLQVTGNTEVDEAANAIEGALVRRGLQAESIRGLLEAAAAETNTFILMLQGFMGLGLLTGIAALGVIAFRSVVERRQQIGMLRAISYQSGPWRCPSSWSRGSSR